MRKPISRKQQLALFLIDVFRPAFHVLAFLLPLIWKVLFSWWLGVLLDRYFDKLFVDELRQDLPFLFDLFGWKPVRCSRPEPKGSQMDRICIATENLIFDFSRWHRENCSIRVSPIFSPSNSYDLVDALRAADPGDQTIARPEVDHWPLFGKLLEPRFHLLETAFSRENFASAEIRLSHLRLSKPPV